MTTDAGRPRSRRALLAASLGAGVAAVASAFGRPSPARAVNGLFDSADANIAALRAYNSVASGGIAAGVWGSSASTAGRGVYGLADAASGATLGVFGLSTSTEGTGVRGFANAAGGSTLGVYGRVDSPDGTAVMGYSGLDADPAPVPKTGVYGYAAQDADARGVWGRATSGRGVYGQASSGQGVRGYAATGSALYGATSGLKKGFALRTVGRVRMDNSVGIATINAGNTSQTVTPGIDLTSTSAVTATLQGSAGAATTTVSRVVVNATNDTFTIYLTAVATADVKVAWHVFG